jgi:hypothetical protein
MNIKNHFPPPPISQGRGKELRSKFPRPFPPERDLHHGRKVEPALRFATESYLVIRVLLWHIYLLAEPTTTETESCGNVHYKRKES